MAVGDFQAFRPSDSAFVNPGEVSESYRAMALERATESSNLERFYASLEEERDQFFATLGLEGDKLDLEERMFELGLAETQRQFDEKMKLENKGFILQQNQADRDELFDWISLGRDVVGMYGRSQKWW